MNRLYELFGKGLKWSYEEYGPKGAVAFVAGAGLCYYLVSQRFDDLLDEAA